MTRERLLDLLQVAPDNSNQSRAGELRVVHVNKMQLKHLLDFIQIEEKGLG